MGKGRGRWRGLNFGIDMVGFRRRAVSRQTEGGAEVVNGRLELVGGELSVAVGVELLKLMINKVGENFVVLNQLHYIRTVHHLLTTFDRLHWTVLVHALKHPHPPHNFSLL